MPVRAATLSRFFFSAGGASQGSRIGRWAIDFRRVGATRRRMAIGALCSRSLRLSGSGSLLSCAFPLPPEKGRLFLGVPSGSPNSRCILT